MRQLGFGFLCFLARENHWWQTHEMAEALQVTVDVRRGYGRVVTYGHSMGAFGALQFAADIEASAVIAMSPQFSINPTRAPHEVRWRGEAGKLEFIHDSIERVALPEETYLFYDPGFAPDRPHIRSIRQAHPTIIPVRCPFSGHYQVDQLIEMRLATSLIHDVALGSFDARRFQQSRRAARMLSERYKTALSAAGSQRGSI